MTIYRYAAPSLIDEVRVVTNATGGHRAYLHARSDATPEQLAEIQRRFVGQGWKTVPYSEEGQPLLEVRGFQKPEELVAYVQSHSWSVGAPTITKLKTDTVSTKDKLRNMTLKGTGLIYNFGDLMYMTYALKGFNHDKKALADITKMSEHEIAAKIADPATKFAEKYGKDPSKVLEAAKGHYAGAKLDVGGGVGYAIGGSVLSLFASKDQSQNEIKNSVKKVRSYMLKEGVAVPQDSSAGDITKKEQKPIGARIKDFVTTHPSEVLNSVYTVVGILLAAASIKKVKAGWIEGETFMSPLHKDVRNDVKDIGLGAITMTSALTGLLVKEKKREPGQPKRGGFGGVWDWIQEKPLRATGVGYFISTLFHAWATYGKYKEGDKFVRDTVAFRAAFVGANILAEALLFASSKGHGQGVKSDDSVEKTVVAATAELIAKQNPATQNQLVDQLAGYMASPEVLGGKAETIANELRQQLAVMHNNPWAQAKAALPAAASTLAVAETKAPVSESVPQNKIAASTIDHAKREVLTPVESRDHQAAAL